ncbi:MAG: hypothetical protein ACK5LJ_07120 [Paracoccus sp. (in: a-proteobacteria)]
MERKFLITAEWKDSNNNTKSRAFKNNILSVKDTKFISSTGTRDIFVTYKENFATDGKTMMRIGTQNVTEYIDIASRWFKYENGKKYIIFRRHVTVINTPIDSYGNVGKTIINGIQKDLGTYKLEDIVEHKYKVKTYDIVLPMLEILGGDIKLSESEELEFVSKSVLKSSEETPENISLSNQRKDYQFAVQWVAKATLHASDKVQSIQVTLKENVDKPFSSISNATTFLGAATVFLSKFTKNKRAAGFGAVLAYIGVGTIALTWAIAGVNPEDIVIVLPTENGSLKYFGIDYRNHYKNQISLDKTPDWGIKE